MSKAPAQKRRLLFRGDTRQPPPNGAKLPLSPQGDIREASTNGAKLPPSPREDIWQTTPGGFAQWLAPGGLEGLP